MRWMQDEQPTHYHVIQWRNSAFHQHSIVKKRKMLGGVSFDGDGVLGSSSKESGMSQTGVQTAQPSFPHASEGNIYANGMGIVFRESITESGQKGNTSGRQGIEKNHRETDTVRKMNDTRAAIENMSVYQITPVTEFPDADKITADTNVNQKDNKPPHVIGKYLRKMQKGIRTLLQGMNQKAGRDSRQKAPKRDRAGTRAVTKEEVYEMQMDAAYLLDSYNKYGERSTLGK